VLSSSEQCCMSIKLCQDIHAKCRQDGTQEYAEPKVKGRQNHTSITHNPYHHQHIVYIQSKVWKCNRDLRLIGISAIKMEFVNKASFVAPTTVLAILIH
jgi:hypothetical protein